MADASEGFAPILNLDDRAQSRPKLDWEGDQAGDQAEVEEVPAYFRRKSAGGWACLAAVTVALAVAVIYGYAVLKQEDIQLEQIPGMAKSLPAIDQHLASLEKRLVPLLSEQQALASQVQSIDAGSKAAVAETQRQTRLLVGGMRQNLLKEINQQTASLQAQVVQLAGETSADRQLLAQTEMQLSQARDDLERIRRDYTLEIAALREQQGVERHEIASLSGSLPTRQVSFEVQKNSAKTLVPGVSFQLTRTDVRHQRFDGLIESAPGSEGVSAQNQGVRNPIMFYPSDHGKGFLLVVTRVEEKEAYGYLLIPSGNGDQADSLAATDDRLNPTHGNSW